MQVEISAVSTLLRAGGGGGEKKHLEREAAESWAMLKRGLPVDLKALRRAPEDFTPLGGQPRLYTFGEADLIGKEQI